MILKGSWYQLAKSEHKGMFNSCTVASIEEYLLFTPARCLSGLSLPKQAEVLVTGQMLQVGVKGRSCLQHCILCKINTVRASVVLLIPPLLQLPISTPTPALRCIFPSLPVRARGYLAPLWFSTFFSAQIRCRKNQHLNLLI